MAEHGDGQLGSLVPSRCRCPELLHAAAELRKSQQAAASIEGLVQLLHRQASAQLMQQQSGVDRAAAGGHHQPLQRREAHGGVDAATRRDGAEGAAGA